MIQVYFGIIWCIQLWRLQRTWNWAKRNIQRMMKEVTDKKYKLQIEEKLWSDQYPAAINCFGLLLEHFKESLWINLGSQILIDLWWNSCQTVKTPLNIQNLPNSKKNHYAPNHQKWHNISLKQAIFWENLVRTIRTVFEERARFRTWYWPSRMH